MTCSGCTYVAATAPLWLVSKCKQHAAAAGYGASPAQYSQYGAVSSQQPAAGYGAAGMQQAQPQSAGGYGGSGTSYGPSAYQQVCTACV